MTDNALAAYINELSDAAVTPILWQCCASTRWIDGVMSARPFESDDALFEVAEHVWRGLEPDDWHEAFAAHPRIGDRTSPGSLSDGEQAKVSGSSSAIREALVTGNDDYEKRFGYVFLICASGRDGDDILRALRKRMNNTPETEIRIAAAEHAKITRLRLEKLVTP